MQLKYSLIIFLFIVALLVSCSAQKNGYVVTNANDTLRGKFKLTISPESSAYGSPKMFALYNSMNTKTNIYTDSIKKIDILKRGKIADTYIISGNNFWRLLAAAKDSLSIYMRNHKEVSNTAYNDYTDFTNHGITTTSVTQEYPTYNYLDIAIFLGNKQNIEIYNDMQNVDNNYIGKQVLKFVNWRYDMKLSFKDLHIDQRKDFVHQHKLFDFILNKEAELESNK